MKKLLALILSGALVVSSLAGCSGGSSGTATPTPAPAGTSAPAVTYAPADAGEPVYGA